MNSPNFIVNGNISIINNKLELLLPVPIIVYSFSSVRRRAWPLVSTIRNCLARSTISFRFLVDTAWAI